jgi:hypothetical protein
MSEHHVPPWLADFQRGFGAVLRAPLDRSSGTLRAVPSTYDASTLASVAFDAPARLAVYNRQYWCRLFNVMQAELPLVTALTGAWTFNDLAGRFLLAHPPTSPDLGRVADGFDVFLEEAAPPGGIKPDGVAAVLPRAALVQAARVDQAFRRVLAAPDEASFRPTAADAARLGRCRLVPSRAVSIVDEGWPLFEMRHRLPRAPASRARSLPAPHPEGLRSWAVCRAGVPAADASGHRVVPLDRGQAGLLRHLHSRTVADALTRLEAEHAGEDPAALARSVQRWLAESMDLGFWTGLEEVR